MACVCAQRCAMCGMRTPSRGSPPGLKPTLSSSQSAIDARFHDSRVLTCACGGSRRQGLCRVDPGTCLRAPYAVPGTDLRYAVTTRRYRCSARGISRRCLSSYALAMKFLVLTYYMLLLPGRGHVPRSLRYHIQRRGPGSSL
eukprot:207010-Rhodomonas_salina.4